jgi:hypothetical protein
MVECRQRGAWSTTDGFNQTLGRGSIESASAYIPEFLRDEVRLVGPASCYRQQLAAFREEKTP